MSLSVTSQVCKNNWTCDAICRESLICVAGVGKNADLRHKEAGPASLLDQTSIFAANPLRLLVEHILWIGGLQVLGLGHREDVRPGALDVKKVPFSF